MISSGYREVWKVHGLVLDQPIHLHIAAAAGGDGVVTHAQVQFLHEAPDFPSAEAPRVAIVGAPTVPRSTNPVEAVDPAFVGSWLMVTVVGRQQLGGEFEARLAVDPEGTANEVIEQIGPMILGMATLWCSVVVGAFAVELERCRFEALGSYVGLLPPPARERWAQSLGRLEVLPRLPANEDTLLPVLHRSAQLLGAPHKVRERLGLGLHWLLRARQERSGSPDRLLWLYLALEAAVKAATSDRPVKQSPEVFKRLRKLAKQHDKALIAFIDQLQSRVNQPFIGDRFRAVSEAFFPEQAEADCRKFKLFGELRGQLVHPAQRGGSTLTADHFPAENLEQFTVRYLSTLVEGAGRLPIGEAATGGA